MCWGWGCQLLELPSGKLDGGVGGIPVLARASLLARLRRALGRLLDRPPQVLLGEQRLLVNDILVILGVQIQIIAEVHETHPPRRRRSNRRRHHRLNRPSSSSSSSTTLLILPQPKPQRH